MMSLAKAIDRFIRIIGNISGYFIFALVILVCIDVFLRYVFNFSRVWILEVELYLFAFSFLLGSAYALQKDQHVRVDVIYANLSVRNQHIINIFGGIFYLLPWTVLMMLISYGYFMKSFAQSEKSSQVGGLPYLFVMKMGIFICFFLLFLQGISLLIQSIYFLRQAQKINIQD